MKTLIALKSAIAKAAYTTGAFKWGLTQRARTGFLVLMYHRLIRKCEARQFVQPGMYVEPDTFERQVKFLARHFNVLPLSELKKREHFNERRHDGRPVCFLTFDDGWQDFYLHAYPILQMHKISATVFLPTAYVGTKRWFWTDRLLRLAHEAESFEVLRAAREFLQIPRLGHHRARAPMEQMEALIETLKGLERQRAEDVICHLSRRLRIESTPHEPGFVTWDEVREMRRSGLVLFGSHTVNHEILTQLDEENVRFELYASRQKLLEEEAVETSFVPFCFPNGNHDPKTIACVKAAGYTLAVTTCKGWNVSDVDLFQLRRIGIHEDVSATEAMFACRVAGIL